MPLTRPPGKHLAPRPARPRRLLLLLLALCLCGTAAAAVFLPGFLRGPGPAAAAPSPTPEAAPSPSPTPKPTPAPEPTPDPTPEPTPAPEPFDFTAPAPESPAVEDDYFDDAVFIGDSRTDGLRLYSGIQSGHFLSYQGATVFDAGKPDKKMLEVDGEKVGLLEALAARQYGKVYIMLGVNETGYPSSRTFAEAYGALIDHIRELQPDAIIYVQSLVPVNPEKCRSHNQPYYVTNEKIQSFTDALIPLAEEKRVVYVDVAAALTGGTGVLPGELTSDGVHFTRSGYVQWLDYLKTHTVDAAAYQAGQAATQQLDEKGTDEV